MESLCFSVDTDSLDDPQSLVYRGVGEGGGIMGHVGERDEARRMVRLGS